MAIISYLSEQRPLLQHLYLQVSLITVASPSTTNGYAHSSNYWVYLLFLKYYHTQPKGGWYPQYDAAFIIVVLLLAIHAADGGRNPPTTKETEARTRRRVALIKCI